MEYGLLGEKLGHSFSPQIHRDLAGYDYQLLPTPPEAVEDLFARRAFQGLNVTIPYKRMVMPLCDEIDPRAAAIGAVNTVVNRNGRLTGYNTDIDGFLYMARRAGVDMAGKKVVILGSGGTSRTARAAAGELGAREIVTVSRHGEDNYQNLSRHADAQVLVNTTPVGMYPNWGQSPVSLESFPALEGVLDVVYNPLRTALLLQAEERGLPCSCGLPMLVAQAKRAAELFTGQNIDDSRAEAVLHGLREQLTSIVLIGMPGCGKTTVGRALAGKLGRTFVDLDEEIVRRAGTSIPEIFAREGERGFRAREAAAAAEAGKRTGVILLTGGGIVKTAANYGALHQNGRIYQLVRDLSLLPTEGRPLSQGADLQAMWRERAPLYQRFRDAEIDNSGTVEDTAAAIWRDFCEHSGD